MKKTIAILLMAIVAIWGVFAANTTLSVKDKTLTLDYSVGSASALHWSTENVSDPNATDFKDVSGDTAAYTGEVTYYAILVTNYSGAATLNVSCSDFANVDTTVGSSISVDYTIGSATTATTATSGNPATGSASLEKGTAKRLVSLPVKVVANQASLDAAVAGEYKATLVATVSAT